MEGETPSTAEDLGLNTQQQTETITEKTDISATLDAIRNHKNGTPVQQPATEEKPAETPAPATETKPEEKQTEETKPATEAPAFKPEDFLKEATKGKIESPEQFTSIFEEYLTLKENPLAALSDVEQQAVLAIRNGVNPMEYLATQAADYDTMSPEEVLRAKFGKDNPDLDKDTADIVFARQLADKYKYLDVADETDADYLADKKLIEREAAKAKADLEKLKEESKFKLPEPQPQENQEELQKQYEQYLSDVKKALADFNDMEFQIGADGSKISVGIEGKESLEKAMANPAAYMDSRWFDNGKWNFDRLRQDIHILENLPKILEQTHLAGAESGAKKFMDDKLKNPSPLASTASQGASGGISDTIQAIRQGMNRSTANI